MSESYPSDWDERRRQVYERDDFECQNCGALGGSNGGAELHAHHIVPKSSGGTHKLSNLKTVCEDCHRSIHNNVDAPTKDSQFSKGKRGQQLKDIVGSTLGMNIELGLILGQCVSEETADECNELSFTGLMYATEMYLQTYCDVIDFASKERPLPDELHKRYYHSRRLCRGFLGKEDISDYSEHFEGLFDSVAINHQPDINTKDIYLNSEHYPTTTEFLDYWEVDLIDGSGYVYKQFLDISKDYYEVLERKFKLFDESVSVDDNGVAVLGFSVEGEWKRQEVNKELAAVTDEWTDLVSKALRQAAEDGDFQALLN